MSISWNRLAVVLALVLTTSMLTGQSHAQSLFDAPPQPKTTAEKTGASDNKTASSKLEDSKADEAESEEASLEFGVGFSTSPRLEEVFLGKADPNLDDLRQLQFRVNELVEKLRPAVVGIRMQDGQGSGVIVTSDGYILTAAHVVGQRGLKAQVVMPDGSTHDAVVLGTDASSDSGMLRLLDKGPWPYVSIGESNSLLQGQWVLALGHPGGFDPDRESVVRVGRMLKTPSRTTLQTDCTLVGGDSGGPLFDLDGFVIGIHSRISRRIQQNYHVSVDIFTTAWDEMSKDARVSFGFSLKDQSETDKLIIRAVDGPVARAGMQVGDELLKINGVKVKSRDDIRASFKDIEVFQTVEVVVRREKKVEKDNNAKASDAEDSEDADSESDKAEDKDSSDESDDDKDTEGKEDSKDQDKQSDDEESQDDKSDDKPESKDESNESNDSSDSSEKQFEEITLKVVVGAR